MKAYKKSGIKWLAEMEENQELFTKLIDIMAS